MVEAIREMLGLEPLDNGTDISRQKGSGRKRKLSDEDCVTIRLSPESRATLAIRYNVKPNTIYRIRKGLDRNVKIE